MFIEGSFSWDQDAERTSLEWPPLMSPDASRPSPAEESRNAGAVDDDIVLLTDPDLTSAELQAQHIDSMVSAAFFAEDHGQSFEGDVGVIPVAAASSGDGAQVYLDESDSWDDDEETPPRRRSSRTKGSLVFFGTAVTVALTGGFAAQAFGWRLPPTLRESAQPMTAFFRNLSPSRLVGLVATTERPMRPLAPDDQDRDGFRRGGVVPLADPTNSPNGSLPASESAGLESMSRALDTAAGQAWIDRDAPPAGAAASLAARAAGEVGRIEQPGEGQAQRVAATGLTFASLPVDQAADRADETSRLARGTQPASREHLPRAARGLVWSPAAHGLVPAIEDPSAATSSSFASGPASVP